MNTWLIATRNQGKAREFQALFSRFGIAITTLFDYPEIQDVEETEDTFEGNARLKAETISNLLQVSVIADDSGLVIPALDGRPGVYSARYAGIEKNDAANIEKVLLEMRGFSGEERNAYFLSVFAIAVPSKKTLYVQGTCQGYIAHSPVGEKGFGYDPIFYIPDYSRTMAELTADEKNEISHRRMAMNELEKILSLKVRD
jgi:XTP/dITP diphosphohydrolase